MTGGRFVRIYLGAALVAGLSTTPVPRPTEPVVAGVAAAAVFEYSITRLDHATKQLMRGNSWHTGCPVRLRRLRYITVTYWRFDGTTRKGALVAHRDFARPLVSAMRALFKADFPIRRMRLVDYYGGDDDRSMAADNTSAFNCRKVAGTNVWSEHAYGRAIDINPVENPYVSGSYVAPPAGEDYVDRSQRRPGMIHGGDAVVKAFAAIGWEWGGHWRSVKDYQHFSSTGR